MNENMLFVSIVVMDVFCDVGLLVEFDIIFVDSGLFNDIGAIIGICVGGVDMFLDYIYLLVIFGNV